MERFRYLFLSILLLIGLIFSSTTYVAAADLDLSQIQMQQAQIMQKMNGMTKVVKEPWLPPSFEQFPLFPGMVRNVEQERIFTANYEKEPLFNKKLLGVKVYTIEKPIEELAKHYLTVFNFPAGWITGEELGWQKYDERGYRDFSLEGCYRLITPNAVQYTDAADLTSLQKLRKPVTLATGENLWMKSFEVVCQTQSKSNAKISDVVQFSLVDLSLAGNGTTSLTQVEVSHWTIDYGADPTKGSYQ